MEKLVAQIENVRLSNINVDERHFVPDSQLSKLMGPESIRNCISELRIAHEYREELVREILAGAWKVFAILLVIKEGAAITAFLKGDHFQQSRVDDKLPYGRELLDVLFGPDEKTFASARFFERQWEFSVPSLSNRLLPRYFDKRIILPYMNEALLGKGNLGRVWKTDIHQECHGFPPGTLQLVRKELDLDDDKDQEAFIRELRNLSLLTFLKHPNIINLLCVYAYRRSYNFVFPVAEHGSLDQLLHGRESHILRDDVALLPALADLTSALDAVHNFTSSILDLQLIGCHHDLAPRNILVDGCRFLLADFGVSRFKSASEGSTTSFKDTRGSYLAPECQTILDGQIATHQVTRASDIWSYGCILSEIMTFLLFGADGVKRFRERRKHDVLPSLTWQRFHCGPDRPNPEVHSWLSQLEHEASGHLKPLVALMRDMLSMSPSLRPTISIVLQQLQRITIDTMVASVEGSYIRASRSCNSLEFQMEKRRFNGWQRAYKKVVHGLNPIKDGSAEDQMAILLNYTAVVKGLSRMNQNLAEVENANTEMQFRACIALQMLNSEILLLLPRQAQALARSYIVDQILQSGDDELMEAEAVAKNYNKGYEATNMLITLRRLTLLANEKKLTIRDGLSLAPEDFEWRDCIDKHCMAIFRSSESLETSPMLVYVEWLYYDARWGDEKAGKELRDRVAMIAELLGPGNASEVPGIMTCQGFIHDPTKPAFGLVYQTLLQPEREGQVVLDLLHMLGERRNTFRPPLEDRFQLAVELAAAIHTFHRLGWLHRRLNPANIVFFPPEHLKQSNWARTPFLIGFTASRQNQDGAFSHGHDQDTEFNDYQDPEYLKSTSRYCQTYDYYSLGILFLEIGLWSPLSQITKSSAFQGLPPDSFKQLIIDKVVPQLAFTMGSDYMHAALVCLERDFEGASKPEDQAGFSVSISQQFDEKVMQKIGGQQIQIARSRQHGGLRSE